MTGAGGAAAGGLAFALDLASFPPYIRAVRRGAARPSRISWLFWSAQNVLLFCAQFARGGRASITISGGEALGCAVLAALAWRQQRAAGQASWWREPDMPPWLTVALLAAVTGALVAWYFSTAGTAVVLAVAVDLTATAITVWKVYRDPASESLVSWRWFGAAALVSLWAVGNGPRILFLYPAAGACTAAAVIGAAGLGGRVSRQRLLSAAKAPAAGSLPPPAPAASSLSGAGGKLPRRTHSGVTSHTGNNGPTSPIAEGTNKDLGYFSVDIAEKPPRSLDRRVWRRQGNPYQRAGRAR